MLYKYKQYNKVIDVFDMMKAGSIFINDKYAKEEYFHHSIYHTLLRSYIHCQKDAEFLQLYNSLIQEKMEKTEKTEKTEKQLNKLYAIGIEFYCHSNKGEDAFSILQKMATTPIPRSCYLLLLSHYSSNADFYGVEKVQQQLKEM